jgi:isopenicillin N synthase-like dioxygenase
MGGDVLSRSRFLDTPASEAPATSRTDTTAGSDSDRKETYAIGPIDAPPRPPEQMEDPDERAVCSPNLWPDAVLPELRPSWEAYCRTMADLAARLMETFARSLGLSESFFSPFIDHHGSAMRMVSTTRTRIVHHLGTRCEPVRTPMTAP